MPGANLRARRLRRRFLRGMRRRTLLSAGVFKTPAGRITIYRPSRKE